MTSLARATLACLLLLAACTRQPANPTKGPGMMRGAAPVRVAKAERRDVPFELRAIGNVEAWSAVAVKSRVSGQLLKVHVRDGADVREGDLLFEIDPLPFVENVRAAEAALARDIAAEKQSLANIARVQAQAANARAQADRYTALFREGIGAREQMDQYRTAADAQDAQLNAERAALDSARAAMRADEARLAEARLQLGYTKIHSPVAGRAGFVNLKAGNLVRENDTSALVTILQIAPIWVTFSVPEQHLNAIRKEFAARKLSTLVISEDTGQTVASGVLDVIDNAVDTATGTIRLKARFDNAARALWPGQFVNVLLQLRTDTNALTVPDAAVQAGPEGRYVWIVTADNKAQMRPVEVARAHGNLSVIAKGLEAGETVITFGQLGVRDGVPVRILEAATKAAETARP
jgi:multidrug efflux system membrane fusion protein